MLLQNDHLQQQDSIIFNEEELLYEIKHLLPSQTPLKDFIHHNSLHAFQHLNFFDAIFHASHLFGFNVTLSLEEYRNLLKLGRIKQPKLHQVVKNRKPVEDFSNWMNRLLFEKPGVKELPRVGRMRDNWRKLHGLNLDDRVHPILFRMLCSYLDQGVAISTQPSAPKGLLDTIRSLEKNSLASFFADPAIRKMALNENLTIYDLLLHIVKEKRFFHQYVCDQQFAHRGWSGMVAVLEERPELLVTPKAIALRDLIHLELLLEMDALSQHWNGDWPLLEFSGPPLDLNKRSDRTPDEEVLELFQEAYEWSYYDEVLAGISSKYKKSPIPENTSFNAVFCIDERECSLRRYLELTDTHCATFGAPGFFGVEFYFLPHGASHLEKLCPAPVTPQYLVRETQRTEHTGHDNYFHPHSNTLFKGTLFTLLGGWMAALRSFRDLLFPRMQPAISNAFAHVGTDSLLHFERSESETANANGLKEGFSIDEMAARVEAQLKNIGMTSNFPNLVYFVAHGSSSANNPHHGAHDCGACSGRPGSVNARVFAAMANHVEVRKLLALRGLHLPESCQFVGALHDTASDQIHFYDTDILSETNLSKHLHNTLVFETALDLNAKERARRFASIPKQLSLKKNRNAILQRSVSYFEPRPELGHGSNVICVIGRRELTKNIFLDRRAFLNSYDPTADPEGLILRNVIKPIAPVCGGINLEYYFSRIDNEKLGAGTKLPHNVMGLIGVANSSDGDLRPGLPLQMIEVHDPMRLLVIVEQEPEVLLSVVQSSTDILDWYSLGWIHLVAISPVNGSFHLFENNRFVPYTPSADSIAEAGDLNQFINTAKVMRKFNIQEATLENLPVSTLN